MPSPEKCDNQDNDCNGMVDEGDGLCPPGEVCSQGVCRHACDDSEFPCAVGLTCDSTDGLCKDRRLHRQDLQRGTGLPAGRLRRRLRRRHVPARAGLPARRTASPHATASPVRRIACARTAPASRRATTSAARCKAGSTCNMTSGVCVETGCESKTCPRRPGLRRRAACKDGCDGVTCPGGQECKMGELHARPAARRRHLVGLRAAGAASHPRDRRPEHQRQRRDRHHGTAGNNATGGGGRHGAERGNISTCSCDTAERAGRGGVALMLAGSRWRAPSEGAARYRARAPLIAASVDGASVPVAGEARGR